MLEPLKEMVNKLTGAVPGIIGAGALGCAGWIIARVVSGLVAIALDKVDQQIADKTGNDEIKMPGLGGVFVFVSILLPIVVSLLGVLNVPAIQSLLRL